MTTNVDVAGQKVALCLRDVKGQSDIIRKNLALANDKEQSISALCDGLAEGCEGASQGQLPAAQSALLGFASVIKRAEASRRVLCDRLAPLSNSCLTVPFQNIDPVLVSLQRREARFKKAQRLPTADKEGQAAKNNQTRTQAAIANGEAIREARTWCAAYGSDLRRVFKEYAAAQMEFAARALEQWSVFLEDLTLVDFGDDTDNIVMMLEGDGI
jgi:hypothetical protein